MPASPRLLQELREYWKLQRPGNYLFPGRTADRPLSVTVIQKACQVAVAKAGITRDVTPHTLRHSYATGMLEAGVDLLTISRLLGHSSFATTTIYLHVRRQHFDRLPSPIDWLPVRQCPQWAEQSEPPAMADHTTTPDGGTPILTRSTPENPAEEDRDPTQPSPIQPSPAPPRRAPTW